MKIDMTADKRSTILVVDDELMNRLVIEDLIGEQYNLVLVDSGQACLVYLSEHDVDLILLDVSMPGMDGFEVCKRLKYPGRLSSIPIVFLTAKIGVEDERLGFELGAVDYITKPFTETILLARVETHLNLSLTRKLLEESLEALNKERSYIEYIMLSMRDDTRFATAQLSMLISPVEKSNGDLVLSAELPNGHRHVLMGDFTGHGLSAAIAAPLVSSIFYTQAEQGIALEQIAQTLNAELCQKLPTEIFMCAVFIDWHPQSGTIKLWNCGMPNILYFRAGQCLHKVSSQSLALGIVNGVFESVNPVELVCAPGDTLFGLSDGVQEVHSELGEAFGEERVESLLTALVHSGEPLEGVQNHLVAFAGTRGIEDDATLIRLDINV